MGAKLDCVVIGYNETPFGQYEGLLRQYGEDSEAYRDLKFSFVDLGGEKLTYPELMNHAVLRARPDDGRLSFRSGEIPNLAAAYLTNFLRRRGIAARYVNLFQDEKDKLADYLADDPLCVAITTTFYVLNFPVNEMVEFIRRHNPRVRVVVGGPLVANHLRNYAGHELDAALADMGADAYVFDSQGESTLARIVACLRDGGDLAAVPNLIVARNGGFIATPHAPENNSLDENDIDWRTFADEGPGPTIQARTARSCAFSCSFCNYPARAGRLTLARLGTIERELDSMRALEARNVVFIDDTFNVPLPRFKEICRLMISRGYGFDWFSYFRCSNSDEEAIDLMAESGCKGVFLGIESGSPGILKNMAKAATLEQYERGIRRLRERGILTFGSYIIGFPGESEETVAETTDFIRRTACDYYRAQVWYCERGTPIDQQRDKYGIEGDGFVWSHASMDSMQAMDHIERMFLSIDESTWLPQWSFDFWIIPYVLGKGVSLDSFKRFMTAANRLLSLGIASVPAEQREALRREHLEEITRVAAGWPA
ncbi:MAG TPA: PhpK family radical SAM P-methyltransferase [Thermoanaerobaculia bacterium]|nr:PhpK family radical SAM P-methyltransferase [Thermoanaerobaculia bacterium]